MISNFRIENFKTFRNIELSDVQRVNLISGKNNVGKSTILEALFLYMDHASYESFGKLNGFRGSSGIGASGQWEPLFFEMDTTRTISISVTDDGSVGLLRYVRDNSYLPNGASGIPDDILAQFRSATKSSYSLRFEFEEPDYHEIGHYAINGTGILREVETSLPGNEIRVLKSTQFINALFSRGFDNLINGIGKLELTGEKATLIQAIQQMDSNIEDILTLSVDGVTQLYVRSAGKLMPLQFAGDGIIKLLSILIAILERKNGLLLIDEVETGFHYTMYKKLWKMIDQISKKSNCQVFATTHSYELIAAVKDNFADKESFAYYRIGTGKKGSVAYRYDYELLDNALTSEMEVR